MRGSLIVAAVSLIISGALAVGYFFFSYGTDVVTSYAAATANMQTGAEQSALAINPSNWEGMILIIGIMILLSAIVVLRRREDEVEATQK